VSHYRWTSTGHLLILLVLGRRGGGGAFAILARPRGCNPLHLHGIYIFETLQWMFIKKWLVHRTLEKLDVFKDEKGKLYFVYPAQKKSHISHSKLA